MTEIHTSPWPASSLQGLAGLGEKSSETDSLAIDVAVRPASVWLQSGTDRFEVGFLGDECAERFERLESAYPAWADRYSEACAGFADWASLSDAAASAPEAFLAGIAAGTLGERLALARITGRSPSNTESHYRMSDALSAEIDALEGEHPAWFDRCTALECDTTAPATALYAHANRAPHPYLAGQLYARMVARVEVRALTTKNPKG